MRLHHVAFTVEDLDESVEFYTEKLGFRLAERFDREEPAAQFAFVELNDLRIELWDFAEQEEPEHELGNLNVKGIRHLAIEVDSIEEKISELENRGLSFSEVGEAATGEYYAFTHDPDGIPLEFYGPL